MSNAIQDTMVEPPNFPYDWYTPLTSEEVKKGKITPFSFMGEKLIAFRNDEGKVIVMDGVCPHFGADMSRGSIVDGMVRCYFHGFYFDSDGQCQKGEVVEDPTTLSKITIGTRVAEECAGQVFLWHGLSKTPERSLPLLDLDWDDWTTPITSKKRIIANSNICYMTENIIDMQHFATVHKWILHELVEGPLVNEAGEFCTDIKVTVSPGAQSENAFIRFSTSWIKMLARIKFCVYSPGLAVATSFTGGTDEKPKVIARNIVCIYPANENDVCIRVAISFQNKAEDASKIPGVNLLKDFGFWVGAQINARIAVADFDGDLKVWENRTYLANPKFVKEDGPMVLFRKWYLRFWHQDYMHELTNPTTTGNKVPHIKVAQI